MTNSIATDFASILDLVEGRVPEPVVEAEDELKNPREYEPAKGTVTGVRMKKYDPDAELAKCDPKEILAKLRKKAEFNGYTIPEIQDIWRRSRQDSESIEIICDLTHLRSLQVRLLLGLTDADKVQNCGTSISNFWASYGETRVEAAEY